MIRLLRSASVRIAFSYAAVFIVSTLLLVSYLWWRTANYLDQEIDAVIAAGTPRRASRDLGRAALIRWPNGRANSLGHAMGTQPDLSS